MAVLQLSPDAVLALAKASVHDRIVGTLFGSALGDAVGLYTEFLSGDMSVLAYPEKRFKLSPAAEATPFRRDAHRNPHQPGEWTDDTDHAMLILLSYLHADGKVMDPQDLASRLSIWVQMGLRALDTLPLGLGRTVGSIVRSKAYLDDPEGTARKHWTNCGYNAAPNGSLMRTHPVGLMCINKTLQETFQIAADFSVVTHVDPRCIISCAIGTALIRGIVRGEIRTENDVDETMDAALQWYSAVYRQRQLQDPKRKDEPDLDVQEFRRHAKVNDLADLKLDERWKIGYVYKTFGSGIHLLRLAMRRVAAAGDTIPTHMSLFEPLVTDLIMRGGDADTNACFAGALVGAYLGFKALPPIWRDGLKHGPWLMEKSLALSKVVGAVEGSYSGVDDKDTAPDGGRGFLTGPQMEERAMLLQAWMVKEEQEWKRQREMDEKKGKSWFGLR